MPIDLVDILARRKHVPCLFMGEDVGIVVQPERITGAWTEELRQLLARASIPRKAEQTREQAIQEPIDLAAQDVWRRDLAAVLCAVTVEWDVVDGGVPIPLDVEHVTPVSLDLLVTILTTIFSAVQTGELSGAGSTKPSASLSKPEGKRATSHRSRHGSAIRPLRTG